MPGPNPDTTVPPSADVSKLAAQVAHELNNPLDAVLRFVSLAQRKAQAGDYADIDRHLGDAQFGLERMAETLRDLMDLGRQTHELLKRPASVALAELITQSIRTASALAEEKHISLIVRDGLPAGLSPRYDQRLTQVLGNLLKNAVEAAPEGSNVRLTAALAHDFLTMTIEDSGPGLPPELLPNLFTPFLTTKPDRSGHGLGLAISRELTISLHGTLALQNRPLPQTGCIATITLPLA